MFYSRIYGLAHVLTSYAGMNTRSADVFGKSAGHLKYVVAGGVVITLIATAASCSPQTKDEDRIDPSKAVAEGSTDKTQSPADEIDSGNKDTQTDGHQKKESISDRTGDPEVYAAYYKVLQEKINTYGTLPPNKDEMNDIVLLDYNGVAYADLLDFDGDGAEELFICYNDLESKSNDIPDVKSPCVFEIWGYKDNKSYLIAKEAVSRPEYF